MQGKTVLITGASAGIGKRTAEKLAAVGTELILVARNKEKTEAVAAEIRSKNPGSQTHVFIADLSLPSEVLRVSKEILQSVPKLDVLLNNAGAFFAKKTMTREGHEATFALNHLSYFLLTNKLLPLLEKSPGARIVNTASQAHVGADIDFDNLQGERKYSGWKAYQVSKLENILFTYELANRLQSSGIPVTVNALHPGFVNSQFGENNSGFLGTALGIAKKMFAIDEDRGSETSFYLCTSKDLDGVTGKYFDECRLKTSSPQSRNVESQKILWEITEKILSPYL
jgi:NAD(P)-dependent dehydrogenase (short-subunit alcohol dehydrogenase family)